MTLAPVLLEIGVILKQLKTALIVLSRISVAMEEYRILVVPVVIVSQDGLKTPMENVLCVIHPIVTQLEPLLRLHLLVIVNVHVKLDLEVTLMTERMENVMCVPITVMEKVV